MIRAFSHLLLENTFQQCREEEGSFGRWAEKRIHGNDYLKSIISPFLIDFDPDIRIANAVDLLNEFDQKQIYQMIKNYQEVKNESAQNEVQGGKLTFKSFIKAIASLGVGTNKVANKNFLIYYETPNLNDDLVVGAFKRFKSLFTLYSTIHNTESRCFFGVDHDLNFHYGLQTVEGQVYLGSFKITKSSFDWTKSLSSSSLVGYKKDVMELSWEDILLIAKIANFMKEYVLGDKYESIFNDGIISFTYYGISKWDNGQIDEGEYANIKSNLKTRLSSEVWSRRILLNVSADNFYLRVNFKLK